MFRSPSSDPALSFQKRAQVKATYATRSICLPVLQLTRLANHSHSSNQLNSIPVLYSGYCSSHSFMEAKKGGWMSHPPLEINTLGKKLCPEERLTCLSAAAFIIKQNRVTNNCAASPWQNTVLTSLIPEGKSDRITEIKEKSWGGGG